jgi:hypothetical protein
MRLAKRAMPCQTQKEPEKQAKKFKKEVAMGVGSAYSARPQFRGSLGFAGYFTPNLCGII